MKKTRELQFSLRYYFVMLFIAILIISCLSAIVLVTLLKTMFNLEGGTYFWLTMYSLVILLVGSLIMWQGSIHLTKPISDLNRAVKRVSTGDFSTKIVRKAYPNDQAPFHNEIDELSQNFNQMSEDLQNLAQLRQDFISNVSHELKTPIASLSGISELLLSDQLELADRADLLHLMQSETDRLSRLCESILNLSGLGKGYQAKDESVNISEQIRHAAIMLTEKWQDKVINFSLPDASTSPIITDADLTMQVWMNVMDNAIKYSPEQVDLTVTYDQTPKGLSVSITDKGIGISSENQRHVFEQFYQADQSHASQGNGLGLAIVKQIVVLLNGEISLVSVVGQGTTVTIDLPNIKS
ncbi:sensor histidine kinase [Streptococcus hongkongensis]